MAPGFPHRAPAPPAPSDGAGRGGTRGGERGWRKGGPGPSERDFGAARGVFWGLGVPKAPQGGVGRCPAGRCLVWGTRAAGKTLGVLPPPGAVRSNNLL